MGGVPDPISPHSQTIKISLSFHPLQRDDGVVKEDVAEVVEGEVVGVDEVGWVQYPMMPILALRGMVIRVAGDGRRLGIGWDGTLSTAAISECRRYKLRTEAMLERICEGLNLTQIWHLRVSKVGT